MPTLKIEVDRFDSLAREACSYVFSCMVDEKAVFKVESDHSKGEPDLLHCFEGFKEGYYSVSVGYKGDARGQVVLALPKVVAERFALKLMDVESLEWLGEDPRDVVIDVIGELGNSFVGLIKGGLTKTFPKLMLTTPQVILSGRTRIATEKPTFRKQYAFDVMDETVVVDFCHG